MSSNTKRTRSKTTLPESYQFPSLERSPLKAARTAARTVNTTFKPTLYKNIFPKVSTQVNHLKAATMKEAMLETNDAMVMSARKSAGKKRPSSGGADEENRAVDVDRERGREYKRARTEEPGVSASPTRRGVSTSRPPSPMKMSTPSRAKSVPPSSPPAPSQPLMAPAPSTPNPAPIPVIDLNKVAASPWRSPSKETFRIAAVAGSKLEVPRIAKTPGPPSARVPGTRFPASLAFSDATPLSPLTPLPLTPFLDKLKQTRTVGRSGLRMEIEDDSKQETTDAPSDSTEGRTSSPTPSRPTEPSAEFLTTEPEPQLTVSTSISDGLKDNAPTATPGPSRFPRLSLVSSAAAPVIPAASSSTPASDHPASQQQREKKPASKTSAPGGVRSKPRERPTKDVVLGSGRVTRSVALRMKASASVKSEANGGKSSDRQAKEPTTPGLAQRKSFSFSFAAPTASSLSKTTAPAQPTTPGKSKPQSRPTTPGRAPPHVASTSKTPSKSSVPPTSIPRRAATVAPLEQKSSLSNLSMALQKLNLPPPSRPSTSLGFSHEEGEAAEDANTKAETQDDIDLGAARKRRASTVGPSASLPEIQSGGPAMVVEGAPRAPSVAKAPGIPKPLVAVSTRLPVAGLSAGAGAKKATLDSWLVKARTVSGPAPRKIFGAVVGGAGRPRMWQRPKASRAPTLEVVEGSPVKGGGAAEADEDVGNEPTVAALDLSMKDEDVFMVPAVPKVEEGQVTPASDKGKGKEMEGPASEPMRDIRPSFKRDASRRASMASQALSQSLSSVPPHTPTEPGLMGPPPVPFGSGGFRRAATVEPSTSTPSTEEGCVKTTATGRPMRAAAMQARSAPGLLGRAAKGTATHVSASRKARAESVAPETGLGVLKDCTIFVDVRTDDGDDAGGLFVEMLMGLGAKILSRAGQTCTHIVFKNGLMSTVTRYRLLNDPKPHVVGIAWVVECVEQRAKADETRFGVDMDGVGIAVAAKRRRPSMLPKHMPMSMQGPSQAGSSPSTEPAAAEGSDAGDQSMDSSSSSLILDETPLASRSVLADSLPPLERARRRRSVLFGQP